MDVQNLSVNMSQERLQEDAAIKVQAMAMQNIRDTAEDLTRLMDSAAMITDPNRGNYLNLFM